MAIQVNGTEVISNSRALNNIASVDATTVAAMGSAGVGVPSAGTFQKIGDTVNVGTHSGGALANNWSSTVNRSLSSSFGGGLRTIGIKVTANYVPSGGSHYGGMYFRIKKSTASTYYSLTMDYWTQSLTQQFSYFFSLPMGEGPVYYNDPPSSFEYSPSLFGNVGIEKLGPQTMSAQFSSASNVFTNVQPGETFNMSVAVYDNDNRGTGYLTNCSYEFWEWVRS